MKVRPIKNISQCIYIVITYFTYFFFSLVRHSVNLFNMNRLSVRLNNYTRPEWTMRQGVDNTHCLGHYPLIQFLIYTNPVFNWGGQFTVN